MSHPVAGSVLDSVFYTIGYALGEAEGRLARKGTSERGAWSEPGADGEAYGAAGPSDISAEATSPDRAHGVATEAASPDGASAAATEAATRRSAPTTTGAALGAAAAAWLIARLLSPRPVRWPRAILAGVAASGLAAAAELIERRLQTIPPETPTVDGSIRLTAGVVAAVAYASLLYPRIPGAPATRGLIFGAIEAATMPAGGTFDLLRRLSPRISIPLETVFPIMVPARGPISAVAFGLGLGFYRDGDT